MHFIDPILFTRIVLPTLIQVIGSCLSSGIVIGLIIGGLFAIFLRPKKIIISGAIFGALTSQLLFNAYWQFISSNAINSPIYYPLGAVGQFLRSTLFPHASILDLRASNISRALAIALLGSLPGAFIGVFIFPKIPRHRRLQVSFLCLGIACTILVALIITPTLAPAPKFVQEQPEQTPLLGTLIGHDEKVNALSFSPNGQWLISGGEDNAIRYWQLPKGSLIRTIRGDLEVNSLAVTLDGQFLISSSKKGIITRQLSSGEVLETLESNDIGQPNVIVSQQGYVLSRGFRVGKGPVGVIKVWQSAKGPLQQMINSELTDKFPGFVDMVVSRDGQNLFAGRRTATGNATISVYELNTGKRLYELESGPLAIPTVSALAITSDGKTMISLGKQTIKIWDLSTNQLIRTLPVQGAEAVQVSPDGKRLISIGTHLQIWQLDTGKLVHSFNVKPLIDTPLQRKIHAIAMSPDGKMLATSIDKRILLWRIEQ